MASGEVFDKILPEKTWVGLRGRVFSDAPSVKKSDGQAEQTRFICTPFMLVGADINILQSNGYGYFYDTSRYPNADAFAASLYPVQCPPKKITFDAAKSTEEINFDLTGYRNSVNNYVRVPVNLDRVDIGLIAYNARDFGYKWIYVASEPDSQGITKAPRLPPQPWEIKQYLGWNSEYNALLGDSDDFQHWQCSRVPAKMTLHLWKLKPASSSDKPDFTVVLNFN